MAGRYGRGVYIRNLSMHSPHSATTLGGVHTFRPQGDDSSPPPLCGQIFF
jgi:hypothetical protein